MKNERSEHQVLIKSPKQEAQNDIMCQPDTMCIASNKELATTSNGPKIKRHNAVLSAAHAILVQIRVIRHVTHGVS